MIRPRFCTESYSYVSPPLLPKIQHSTKHDVSTSKAINELLGRKERHEQSRYWERAFRMQLCENIQSDIVGTQDEVSLRPVNSEELGAVAWVIGETMRLRGVQKLSRHIRTMQNHDRVIQQNHPSI